MHVVELFSGGGGLENVVKNIVLNSMSDEIEHCVCVLGTHGYLGYFVKEKGIRVYNLNRLQRDKNDIAVTVELRRLVKRLDINIVHAHNFVPLYFSTLATLFMKAKVIATFHGFTEWNLKKRIFYDTVFSIVRVVVVNSAMKKNYSFLGHIFSDRIETVVNGIDCTRFNQEIVPAPDLMKEIGIQPKDFVLGSVGRLSPVKNQQLQLKIIAKLKNQIPNLKLLIITGASPDSLNLKKELNDKAAKYGITRNLILLDFRKDVPALLSLMDIFLMTSLTEGTSLAILEAMSSGLPVVASNVGGNSKIIEHEKDGFLFELHDETAFINILLNLYKDKKMRIRIGDAARAKISMYSIENMVKNYEKIYGDYTKKGE